MVPAFDFVVCLLLLLDAVDRRVLELGHFSVSIVRHGYTCDGSDDPTDPVEAKSSPVFGINRENMADTSLE